MLYNNNNNANNNNNNNSNNNNANNNNNNKVDHAAPSLLDSSQFRLIQGGHQIKANSKQFSLFFGVFLLIL